MGGRGSSRSAGGGGARTATQQAGPRMIGSLPAPSDGGHATPDEMLSFLNTATPAEINAFMADLRNTQIGERENDTDVQRMYNYLGLTANNPTVLPDAQFRQAYANAATGRNRSLKMQYHTDAPYGSLSPGEMNLQLQGTATDSSGNPLARYVSQGIYGGGTYFAAGDPRGSFSYGRGNGSQVRAFIQPGSRSISESNLRREYSTFRANNRQAASALESLSTGYGGSAETRGMYAAIRGYQVITASRSSNITGGYNVVLDTGCLTMSATRMAQGAYQSGRGW